MENTAFIEHITSQPDYAGQIAYIEKLPYRRAVYTPLEKPLPQDLQDCLTRHGYTRFYSHQAEAINYGRRGSNVMVVTSSASGKSLIYQTLTMEALLAEKNSRALYLFPTKALAQDQLRSLRELFCRDLLFLQEVATFDGDTPYTERSEIKKSARIILSNPDMLHMGIMPNHQQWAKYLRHLKYVVIDEAHAYRGVFGSHVADVVRRLRRLCEYYGSKPQFICCSATIANPGEHASQLVGMPFKVVASDGAPHGRKDFIFWNPPIIDRAKSVRRSANSEATYLFTELVSHGTRALTFTRTRRLTELMYIYSKQRLEQIDPYLSNLIKPYRAGYLPEQRRQIEKELFEGRLLGAVATNALELGIDIGDLDATVLSGYPGTIASTWQQAGRSGRSQGESLSFLVALDGPLDQYFMHHPEAFFGKTFENALVNPQNKYILRAHILCAAWELPLTRQDEALFGVSFNEEVGVLEQEGLLKQKNQRWYPAPAVNYPAQKVSIRSTSNVNYAVVDSASGALLEMVESSVAFFQIHPGAIYLHQGESYLITRLDLTSHTAYAKPSQVNYYTQTKELSDLRILNVLNEKKAGQATVHLGEVEVTTEVVGFKKKVQFTEEVIGEEPLELPPQTFPTVAVWFDIADESYKKIEEQQLDLAGGLHAVEHAAIGMLPLFALCDRNDIGGISTAFHPSTGKAQVFIYDAYPGGIGIAERGFAIIKELWQATLRSVNECPCDEGCPSCIQSPKCGNNNKPLDKKAAQIILEGLLKKA